MSKLVVIGGTFRNCGTAIAGDHIDLVVTGTTFDGNDRDIDVGHANSLTVTQSTFRRRDPVVFEVQRPLRANRHQRRAFKSAGGSKKSQRDSAD